VIEAATVVWWGLFEPLDGVHFVKVAAVVGAWSAIAGLLLLVLARGSRPVETTNEVNVGIVCVARDVGDPDAPVPV
jgi:hypothetical protein